MKLGAEQWMVLGIGAIGLYALYRMTRATNASNPQGETSPRPTSLLPQRPNPVSRLPDTVAEIVGSPIHLTNSRAYRGRIDTRTPGGVSQAFPFSPNASRDQIVNGLRSLGFENVQVYMTPEEAGAPFASYAIQGAGQGTRWFYGRYLGPTRDVARPQALSLLWISRALNQA